jgi:hypothetical protein
MGDGVSDTAAHTGPTYSQPNGYDSCWQNISPKLNTCPDTFANEAAGMDIGDDPVDNFVSGTGQEFMQTETWNIALHTYTPPNSHSRLR